MLPSRAVSLPEPPAKEPTALDCLREEYVAYLRQQRALSEATIYHCLRFPERFMGFRFGETLGDLNAITPDDIVAFLGQLKAGSRPDFAPPGRSGTASLAPAPGRSSALRAVNGRPIAAPLGHANPEHTFWYIEAVPELLQLAANRAERSILERGAK